MHQMTGLYSVIARPKPSERKILIKHI